jgi:hypothetical protein
MAINLYNQKINYILFTILIFRSLPHYAQTSNDSIEGIKG